MKSSMRRLIIDRLLSEKGLVPFDEITSVLQVSAPTVKRDLRYMREQLGAPIRYSKQRGGYFYDVSDKEPRQLVGRPRKNPRPQPQRLARKQWYTSEELYVLASTVSLLGQLSEDKQSAIFQELEPLRARVSSLLCLGEIEPKELLRRVKIVSPRVPYEEPPAFETIGAALSIRRRVLINYYSASRGEHSSRTISPMRLVHYKNRWYVDAYCHQSEGLRTFLIENIESAEVLEESAIRYSLEKVKQELDAGYGIFHGAQLQEAHIHLPANRVAYVLREAWHSDQKVVANEDGSAELYVPYSNPTEIVGEILRWGAGVEVKAPEALKALVAAQALEIASLYDFSRKA